jgi:hypothetical protein
MRSWLAPRAPEEIVRPRRLAGMGARHLGFTVRPQRQAIVSLGHSWPLELTHGSLAGRTYRRGC